jgi:hypothetical protein
MVTISHMVEHIVNERPLLFQAIEQDIVSYGNLAAQLQDEISKGMGKEVKHSAIVMALRRYSDKIQKKSAIPKFDFHSEINMKTNLCDFAVRKSRTIFPKLESIQKLAEYDKGDFLNISHGNNEVSIVTNMKHMEQIKAELKDEDIIKVEVDLVSLSLNFSEKFLYTPGVISTIVRKLTWEDINIFELVSTFSELNLIISKKDAMRGYNALQRIVEG